MIIIIFSQKRIQSGGNLFLFPTLGILGTLSKEEGGLRRKRGGGKELERGEKEEWRGLIYLFLSPSLSMALGSRDLYRSEMWGGEGDG